MFYHRPRLVYYCLTGTVHWQRRVQKIHTIAYNITGLRSNNVFPWSYNSMIFQKARYPIWMWNLEPSFSNNRWSHLTTEICIITDAWQDETVELPVQCKNCVACCIILDDDILRLQHKRYFSTHINPTCFQDMKPPCFKLKMELFLEKEWTHMIMKNVWLHMHDEKWQLKASFYWQWLVKS